MSEKDYEKLFSKKRIKKQNLVLNRAKTLKDHPCNFNQAQEKITRYRTREFERRPKQIGDIFKSIKDKVWVESEIESFMCDALRDAGFADFEMQYEVGNKRVDFAFPDSKLIIECDGHKYHKFSKEQIEADQQRDLYLAKRGWVVLHFSGIQIRRDIKGCINKIRELKGEGYDR